jgi:hypothetical protein
MESRDSEVREISFSKSAILMLLCDQRQKFRILWRRSNQPEKVLAFGRLKRGRMGQHR